MSGEKPKVYRKQLVLSETTSNGWDSLKKERGHLSNNELAVNLIGLYRLAIRKGMLRTGAKITVEVDGEIIDGPFEIVGHL